jgi:hypothetical protein
VIKDNVVPFISARPGGMARRGAPDKSRLRASEWIVLRCPSCDSVFRLEPEWSEGHADVLCGGCEREIPLPALRRKIVR